MRLVGFSFGSDLHEAAQSPAKEFVPAIRAQKECGSATFFGDYTDGSYGLFVLWRSRAEADDDGPVIGHGLQAV